MEYSIVGIDQSLTASGVCLITPTPEGDDITYSLIKPRKLRGVARLRYIRDSIKTLLINHKAKIVTMEGYSLESKNTPFALGEIGGIIKMTCDDLKIPCYVAPPKVMKKFVTGTGMAGKVLIKNKYKLSDDNLADARGLAEMSRCILTDKYSTRHEYEAVLVVKQNPENLKLKSIAKKRKINRQKYKTQTTVI